MPWQQQLSWHSRPPRDEIHLRSLVQQPGGTGAPEPDTPTVWPVGMGCGQNIQLGEHLDIGAARTTVRDN